MSREHGPHHLEDNSGAFFGIYIKNIFISYIKNFKCDIYRIKYFILNKLE